MSERGRMRATSVEALASALETTPGSGAAETSATTVLCSPGVGWFVPACRVGELVAGGAHIGELQTLGHHVAVTAPRERSGRVIALGGPGGRFAVGYRDPLFMLAAVASEDPAAAATQQASSGSGLRFVAPSSGRFYIRSGPGKPTFVSVGDVVTAGQTLCLLEVMKTFHRVTYGGAGLPDRARIAAILKQEEADVGLGEALFSLEEA